MLNEILMIVKVYNVASNEFHNYWGYKYDLLI